MNFFKHIRIATWWFKLPPFLVLIYLYFIKENIKDFGQEIFLILFLLSGVISIAVFASLINNYYDQEDDAVAGKENKMINLGKNRQFLVLGSSILAGILFSFFIFPNFYALVFYWLSWFCFYIYSCKQFRLKEKTYLGVIFDGLGSQFFPSLFIFSFLYKGDIGNHLVFIISGSIWMTFSFGMRSLIIHQYDDYENDIKAGVSTFVNSTSQLSGNLFQGFILFVEIISFMLFMWAIDWKIFVFPILIYVLLVVVFKIILKLNFYFFKPLQNQRSRSLFFDFYITILPFALLALLTFKNHQNGILLVASIILFNVPTLFNAMKFLKIKN
ncbi:MAG: UbiA family prenyltransferase [Flavobacterium circumlabens]|uniref:UbiA family prenyltransferase n=1 Tax=Flavobacterium circumlabens TaxID=2133765 RepID=UPI0032636E8A